MTKGVTEEFHLDEPATETHNPTGWVTATIELVPSGKAPKIYGADVFRFGAAMTLSVILPRRGWELVKQTKNYTYLKRPEGCDGPPFKISIAVPTGREFLAIAQRAYERGDSWFAQLGEWPAWYFHERNQDMRESWRDPTTGEMISKLHKNPPQSSLSIGEWGAWQMRATATGGEFILAGATVDQEPQIALWEGEPKSVELTRYERSPIARRKCIEHFGPTCQACGLNYEQKYGAIGTGLIHVHHVVPVSAVGEGYEVDPARDLVPLCATCHHVVHSRNPSLSVEEVKAAIAVNSSD